MNPIAASPLPVEWVALRFDDAFGPRSDGVFRWRPHPRVEISLDETSYGPAASLRLGNGPPSIWPLRCRGDMVAFIESARAMAT